MIELNSTTRLYGTVIGVNDITLSLKPGAYGLLGPNGSGKTTLLNMLTGQLSPTLGSVRVFGRDPRNNSEMLERIGYCPGVDAYYANVTAFEWVRYLMELHGFSRSEAGERSEETLELVGLSGAMHRHISGYSRGMKQRTKLAQALAHKPEFLILDEPFNGLDPIGRHDLTEILRTWIQEGGSLLLASHILHEVEAITHSFLLICGGRLLASGSSEEVNAMLADTPDEIRIRCTQAPLLARRLIEEEVVDSIRFSSGGDELILATRSAGSVYEQLPHWIEGTEIRIHEIQSSDGSLQALFSSLMRIHRGEQ